MPAKKHKLTVEVHRTYVFDIEVTAKQKKQIMALAEDTDDFTHTIREGAELAELVYEIDEDAWRNGTERGGEMVVACVTPA